MKVPITAITESPIMKLSNILVESSAIDPASIA